MACFYESFSFAQGRLQKMVVYTYTSSKLYIQSFITEQGHSMFIKNQRDRLCSVICFDLISIDV